MALRTLLFSLFLLFTGPAAYADDWPTFMHDNRRSGVTDEQLSVTDLAPDWVYVSPHRPQQAFAGPAPRDYYNAPKKDIKSRMDFDRVFHVIVAGGKLYFGSSLEDSIFCLEPESGEVVWRFFTDGPVRMAPTYHDGNIYAGSDDGIIYCLAASSGNLIWKERLSETDYRVPYNGKMISLWPVRSGVLLEDGVLYAAAGFLQSEGVFMAAMDPATGKSDGDGFWRIKNNEISVQGYMLSAESRLFMTAGRSTPYIFSKSDGEKLGQVGGGGGTYALLTPENEIVYGPSREGGLEASSEESKSVVATFDGNHIIVTSEVSYMHGDVSLSALDRHRHKSLQDQKLKLEKRKKSYSDLLNKIKEGGDEEKIESMKDKLKQISLGLIKVKREIPKSVKWSEPCAFPHSLILAGETLFAGGDGEVAAIDSTSGLTIWTGDVEGAAYGLAVANGSLYVSTDQGTIHAFR